MVYACSELSDVTTKDSDCKESKDSSSILLSDQEETNIDTHSCDILVKRAIANRARKTGSSMNDIINYVRQNYDLSSNTVGKVVESTIKRLRDCGYIYQHDRSQKRYKLTEKGRKLGKKDSNPIKPKKNVCKKTPSRKSSKSSRDVSDLCKKQQTLMNKLMEYNCTSTRSRRTKKTRPKPKKRKVSRQKTETRPKPSSKKPSSNKPSSKKPSSNKPSSKKPSSNKPSSKKPSSNKPSSKKRSSQTSHKKLQNKIKYDDEYKKIYDSYYKNSSHDKRLPERLILKCRTRTTKDCSYNTSLKGSSKKSDPMLNKGKKQARSQSRSKRKDNNFTEFDNCSNKSCPVSLSERDLVCFPRTRKKIAYINRQPIPKLLPPKSIASYFLLQNKPNERGKSEISCGTHLKIPEESILNKCYFHPTTSRFLKKSSCDIKPRLSQCSIRKPACRITPRTPSPESWKQHCRITPKVSILPRSNPNFTTLTHNRSFCDLSVCKRRTTPSGYTPSCYSKPVEELASTRCFDREKQFARSCVNKPHKRKFSENIYDAKPTFNICAKKRVKKSPSKLSHRHQRKTRRKSVNMNRPNVRSFSTNNSPPRFAEC